MIIILIGAPGAGKGTQADLIAERQGFKKVSTGDALRRHIKQGTEIGSKAKSLMADGKLVPDDILLGILHSELEAAGKKSVLLDGYPRNLAQAKSLQMIAGLEISAVIHLDVEEASLILRISGRRTCSSCGTSYHVVSSPAKSGDRCDKCSNELIQRPDDLEDKVRVRLQVYQDVTRPVLDFYRDLGIYHRVDGNDSTEEVYQALTQRLRELN